jgi:glycyl-tRNA synthetase
MTLRERDTTLQLIGKIEEVITLVHDLCRGSCTWDEAQKRLPAYTGEQDA